MTYAERCLAKELKRVNRKLEKRRRKCAAYKEEVKAFHTTGWAREKAIQDMEELERAYEETYERHVMAMSNSYKGMMEAEANITTVVGPRAAFVFMALTNLFYATAYSVQVSIEWLFTNLFPSRNKEGAKE